MGKRTVGFEDLDIYKLSERLSDQAWDVVQAWRSLARDTVGKQLVRSADSIGANIAEGSGRGTYKDNCRFCDIARGSLYETRHWLRRAYRRRLLPQRAVDHLRGILDEPGPRLNAYRNSIRRAARTGPKNTTASAASNE